MLFLLPFITFNFTSSQPNSRTDVVKMMLRLNSVTVSTGDSVIDGGGGSLKSLMGYHVDMEA